MGINIERKQFPLLYVHQHGRGIIGWGAHKLVADESRSAGIKHALLVTTGLKGTGIVDEIKGILQTHDIAVTIFDKITSNPKDFEVRAGTQVYIDAGCDGIVSVGGGSAHDTGKGIRIMVTNDGPNTDLRDFAAFLEPHYVARMSSYKVVDIPHVAVNTTTGTGAEATAAAIVNDVEWRYKLVLMVPGITPCVGLNDPALMRTQPPHLVAWTGMDAFCHAMEPFIGRINMPVVHAVALHAIKLISENLRQAFGNPANDVAIENMAWAQYIASMSYNMGGGMGMVHGLAHMVSILKDLHHGYTNAIMMMPVERFNAIAVPERFKEIGEAMGLDIHHLNSVQATEKTLEAIERLRMDIDIAQVPLKEFDFSEDDIEHAIKWILNDMSREANPRDMNAEQIRKIMRSCL